MKVSVICASELDQSTRQQWRSLQAANAALASPYFTPEFTEAVAAVRDDVRIAVLEDGGLVQALFPHQQRWGRGAPAGGGLSDHHGLICAPHHQPDWPALLRACRLSYWRFDHLPRSQAPQAGVREAFSPALDLSQGFAAYKARAVAGSRRVAELERKARKLAREVGPLRFEVHSGDRAVFETVLRLKSQQCQRTGVPDFFALPWTRALVERIWQTDDPHFAGRLSALYAGDTLVAAHLGMRSRQAWHWWFPVYDHSHARHSPGGHLLLAVAQAAAQDGAQMLDLGKGDDAYKESFADTGLPLAEGWVTRPALVTAIESARQGATHWLKAAPALQPLRSAVRRLRRTALARQA